MRCPRRQDTDRAIVSNSVSRRFRAERDGGTDADALPLRTI